MRNLPKTNKLLSDLKTRYRFPMAVMVFLGVVLSISYWHVFSAGEIGITINPAVRYQTILGWEATAQAGQDECAGFSNYRDDLFDQAVGGLGLNRLRLEIYSGAENPVDYYSQYLAGQISRDQWKEHWFEIINDNANAQSLNGSGYQFAHLDYQIEQVVQPVKQRLEARGEKLFINVNYVDFGPSSFEHKNNPAEYGEFVLATYQHLQSKYGWVPDAWEVILEPDTSADWTGNQIGQSIAAAASRLQSAGFTPAFIAPSTTSMHNAPLWFEDIAQVPGAADAMLELSYHRYTGVNDGDLQAIASLAEQHGLGTSMLEHIGSGHEDLHQDLKLGRNSGWQQYTLGFCVADDGAQYFWVDNSNPQNPVVHMGSRTRYLKQYFYYVRAGAIRIKADTEHGDFDPLAFINPNGKYVVVVRALRGGAVSVGGLPAGTYGLSYTTGGVYNQSLPDTQVAAGQALVANIPDSGVLTIFGKNAGTIPPRNQPSLFMPLLQRNDVQQAVNSPVTNEVEGAESSFGCFIR